MSKQIKKTNPFGDIGSMIADGGLGELLVESNRFDIDISAIKILKQTRTEFVDSETLELAESVKAHGVLQNIIVNEKADENGVVYYELIAGERRVRASTIADKNKIPALVLKVTDEEARQIQILENIQRENLTAIDLANALDSELKELEGDYDKLAVKYNKSRSWLSKAIQMNKVTGSAQDVMTVSSDPEVILGIQQIEKTNPEKAEALVDQIKSDFGKKNVRKTVKAELKKEKEDQRAKKTGSKPKAAPATAPTAAPTEPAKPEAAPTAQPEPQPEAAPAKVNTPKEYPLGGEEVETEEVQDIINFGDALDIFSFSGKEVPDTVYDAVSARNETFRDIYEKVANEKNLNALFLKTLKKAGFKLDQKDLNLSALIELVVIANCTELYNLERLTLNIRDTLDAFKDE